LVEEVLSEALEHLMTLPLGKVYGRKDAAWAEVPPTATAVSQLSNDSRFITADAIPTGLVFLLPGLK
jgi:hypothetical protein